MRLMLDWLMVKHKMMVEYRYVSMDFGDQCVMISGIAGMLEWYVDNLDMMDVSLLWSRLIYEIQN